MQQVEKTEGRGLSKRVGRREFLGMAAGAMGVVAGVTMAPGLARKALASNLAPGESLTVQPLGEIVDKEFMTLIERLYGKNEGVVLFDNFLNRLPTEGRLIIGESHIEPTHIQTVEAILDRRLKAGSSSFVVLLERFSVTEKADLEGFRADKTSPAEVAVDRLFEETEYKRRWGGRNTDTNFEYSQMLGQLRENDVQIRGLDLTEDQKDIASQQAERNGLTGFDNEAFVQARRDEQMVKVLADPICENSVTVIGRHHVQKGYWFPGEGTLAQGALDKGLDPILIQQTEGVEDMDLNAALERNNVGRVVIVKPERVITYGGGPRERIEDPAADFMIISSGGLYKSPFINSS